MKRAMKQTALRIFILSLVATVPALADEWAKTYSISGKPDLRVETSDANIHVITWDQNTIEAKVVTSHYKIGEGGIRIEEHQDGDIVQIDVRYPHHAITVEWGQHKVDITIQMPREGKVNLRTGDGRIELAAFKGEMDLHTGDGSETLDGVDGRLRASTGDGHIRANGRFDELDLKTGDGPLDVTARPGSSMASDWRFETGDGSVTLALPSDLPANVDLHTNDGHIDLEMPVTTTGQVHENAVRGKLNGGGSALTIRTGDGSIHLRKS
jgi:DUF4097 and DUF4098 domain-containing protein YvlB